MTTKQLLGKLSKHIWGRLLSGILVLIPIVLPIYLVIWVGRLLAGFASPYLERLLPNLNALMVEIISFITTAAAIYLAGLLTTLFIGRQLLAMSERFLMRLPIVKTLYGASKQIVDAFSMGGKRTFEAVVLVEYPRRGIYTIGFVTGRLKGPTGEPLYSVFIATAPNPTSGYLALLPAADVHFTGVSVEEGIKMIVSGGMLVPDKFKLQGSEAHAVTVEAV